MTPIIQDDHVVQFLMWACTVLGGGLIGTLLWTALGVIRRLEAIQTSNNEQHASIVEQFDKQFRSYEVQLAQLHDLVMQDLHRHDVRIVRLEEWRKSVDHEYAALTARSHTPAHKDP